MASKKKIADVLRASKNLVRTGWMQRGIHPSIGETVAEHSFEVAFLAVEMSLKAKEKGLNVDIGKVAAMALIHDLAETVVGDLPKWTSERVGKLKVKLEREAFEMLDVNTSLYKIFEQYLEGKSSEAKLVKAADALSTCMQAREYLLRGYDVHNILESSKRTVEKLSKCCKGVVGEVASRVGCL
ncbi:MAG: HD family hydrolase [Desulfurococcales archaeon]|nr:HD family hydrolase [Desulfurococcales archaeon]